MAVMLRKLHSVGVPSLVRLCASLAPRPSSSTPSVSGMVKVGTHRHYKATGFSLPFCLSWVAILWRVCMALGVTSAESLKT